MRAASFDVSWPVPLSERRRFVRSWAQQEGFELNSDALEFLAWCYCIEVRDISPARDGWYWEEFLEFSNFDPVESARYTHEMQQQLDESIEDCRYRIIATGQFITVFDHHDGDLVIVSTIPGDEVIYDMEHGDLPIPLFQNIDRLVQFLIEAYRIGYADILDEKPARMYYFRPLREFAAMQNPSIAFWREDHPLIWDWPEGFSKSPAQ